MGFKIFLSPPHIEGNEMKYVENVFKSNYIAPVGEYLDKFEKSICEFTGAEYCVALSSGTAAIHTALNILGVKENDYVLVSTFTFIGSVSPVIFQKAIPVFIDSERDSWNIDVNLVEKAVKKLLKQGKKPKALIVVHLYGEPANLNAIEYISKKYEIPLIEDAAESLGATYNGKHTGTFGDFGIFSFNGNKIITTSGGGALVSNNGNYIKRARFLSTQAKEDCLWYEHKEIGFNYRMSNVLAAIGVGQMETLKRKVEKKRKIFELYKKLLENSCEMEFMPELENAKGSRWLTTAIFKNNSPFKIIEYLKENGIEARPLWKPMHLQPVFKNSIVFENGVSKDLFEKGICLPSGTELTTGNIEEISDIIKAFLQ